MGCLIAKNKIKGTFESVRNLSYHEKTSSFSDEERINQFLDVMIDFKKELSVKTAVIIDISERVDKLTWIDELDDECKMLLNDLISSLKDLHSSMIRQYVAMDIFRKKGIAKSEIKNFKNAIDDIKESTIDLESIFFFLPDFPEFKEVTKQLSLI